MTESSQSISSPVLNEVRGVSVGGERKDEHVVACMEVCSFVDSLVDKVI